MQLSLWAWSRSKDNFDYINVLITLQMEFKITTITEIPDESDI